MIACMSRKASTCLFVVLCVSGARHSAAASDDVIFRGGFDIPVCGNGALQGIEVCDDGNVTVGDGCSDKCEVENGFVCTAQSPSECAAICADGIKAGAEQCDDANFVNGDGCSSSCQIETGYMCVGSPSVCTKL